MTLTFTWSCRLWAHWFGTVTFDLQIYHGHVGHLTSLAPLIGDLDLDWTYPWPWFSQLRSRSDQAWPLIRDLTLTLHHWTLWPITLIINLAVFRSIDLCFDLWLTLPSLDLTEKHIPPSFHMPLLLMRMLAGQTLLCSVCSAPCRNARASTTCNM